MTACIREEFESRLGHMDFGAAPNVNDARQTATLLHLQEVSAFGDAGYRGADKRPETTRPTRCIAMQPCKRSARDLTMEWARLLEKAEQLKASVRAKIDRPVPCFRHSSE